MGTKSTLDDTMIFMDPYDTSDHYRMATPSGMASASMRPGSIIPCCRRISVSSRGLSLSVHGSNGGFGMSG